jgi:hypothetical protein
MTCRFLSVTAAIALLGVAGCTQPQPMTPEIQASMLDNLKAGKATLTCGVTCSFTWIAQAPSVHQLDLAEKWEDLAVRVQQINYGSDLAYYYLGQAAQGLNAQQAAITYYNQALFIANGVDPLLRCEGSNSCQDVNIASSIPVLIKASQDAIVQQQQQAEADAAAAAAAAAAQQAPVHHKKKPVTTASSVKWQAPPESGGSASTAATASTGPGGSSGSGWSAPPPPASQ